MNTTPAIRFELVESPACAVYFDRMSYPSGRGALPAMPPLVLIIDSTSDSVPSLPDAYCSVQIFDETGQTQLPSEILSGILIARPSLIPSLENPDQLQMLFIFGEILIAAMGIFRLRVILHENATHTEVASLMSEPVEVISYQDFPGPFRGRISTPLSQHLRSHGILLHSPLRPDGLIWTEGPNGINGSESESE